MDVTTAVARTAHGKHVDVYRPGEPATDAPVVLLWHGTGCDERDVMRPLAQALAGRGLVVFVPDWRSDAADGGRAHLLSSLDLVREHAAGHGGDTGRLVLAGWSAGAPAAAGLAGPPGLPDGLRPTAVVGIAGRYDVPARTTGEVPEAGPEGAPVWLVHGTHDTVVEASHSRDFADRLRRAGRTVHHEELPTDHAGVLLSAYDPRAGRCLPSDDPAVVRHGQAVADLVARAAGPVVTGGRGPRRDR